MAVLKKNIYITNTGKNTGKEELSFMLMGGSTSTTTVEIGMEISSEIKLKVELSYEAAIPLLSTHPKDAIAYHKNTCISMFILALFILARTWRQPRCS